MKNFDGRLSKLEHRFGIAASEERFLLILTDRDLGQAEQDAYIKILDEGGFLHASGVGIVDFTVIPRGLNAKEAERFVRENGAKICNPRGLPRIAK